MLINNFLLKSNYETELREEEVSSSLYDSILVRSKETNEGTDKVIVSENSTPIVEVEKIAYIDELIIKRKALVEQNKLNEIVKNLTSELVMDLKYFSADEADISFAERKVLEIEEKYSIRLIGEILQNIYIKYNDYPNMLAGICKALGRFELSEVMPWGPTMLMGLLSHKSEMVKEYAVAVVEEWADLDLLPILRNLDCSSEWLKGYIENVIDYLGEYNGIHKKTI